MNGLCRLLLVVWPVLLAGGCSKKPTVDMTIHFEGDWKILELSEKGVPASAQTMNKLTVVIQKESFQKVEDSSTGATSSTSVSGPEVWNIRVDNLKDPAEIDLIRMDGPDQGKMRQGIFLHEDTKLTICYGELGEERPTSFTGTPKTTLMKLERKK